MVPREIWLQDLSLAYSGQWAGNFRGRAFLDDPRKEREMVDDFVYNFSKNSAVRNVFDEVALVATSIESDRGFNFTTFDVNLK